MLSLTSEQEQLFNQYYPAAIKFASTSGMEFGSGLSLALIALCKSAKAYNSNKGSFSNFYHRVFHNMVAMPYHKGLYYGDDIYYSINKIEIDKLKIKLAKIRQKVRKLEISTTEADKLLQNTQTELDEFSENMLIPYTLNNVSEDREHMRIPEEFIGTLDHAEGMLMVKEFKEKAKEMFTELQYNTLMLCIDGYNGKEISEKLSISIAKVGHIKYKCLPKIIKYFK